MNTNTTTILARLAARERQRIAAQIRERRDALAAQHASAERQEAELRQALALLRRNMDAMSGGLQELDGQLEQLDGAGA